MRDGSGDDVDPTIRNWVIRKYEEGTSRSEIKSELEDEVDDLSVVDRIIDSGQAKRKSTADPELFEKGFPKMYKGALRGTIGMEETFFRTISQQSVMQSTGVMAVNAGVLALLAFVLPMLLGGLLGMGGLGFAAADGLMGAVMLFIGIWVSVGIFAVIVHILSTLVGGDDFKTTYNICADMTSLLLLAVVPIVGYFVWLYALVVLVRALEEAHGIGFFRSVFVTLMAAILWSVVTIYGLFQIIPGFV